LCASPQAAALGRQRSRYLRQAHFITSSKKGLSEPRMVGKTITILNEKFPEVK